MRRSLFHSVPSSRSRICIKFLTSCISDDYFGLAGSKYSDNFLCLDSWLPSRCSHPKLSCFSISPFPSFSSFFSSYFLHSISNLVILGFDAIITLSVFSITSATSNYPSSRSPLNSLWM